MKENIARLARKITRESSKQTYWTIRLLVDSNLRDYAYCGYAYFRYLDDEIDENLKTKVERLKLIRRQELIIRDAYRDRKLPALRPEEKLLVELVKADINRPSQLTSFISNFLAIIKFDAKRRGKFVSKDELRWYSQTLGVAVTDCIEYFIGHSVLPKDLSHHYDAAIAAHMIHMLRDQNDDMRCGYFNIPKDYDQANWKEEQKREAKELFTTGRMYIARLQSITTRIAAYFYCLRFELILPLL